MSGRLIATLCLGLLAAAGAAAAGPTDDVIVFEKWMPDESLQRWGDTVELWSVRSDGSDVRQLTHGSYDIGASWSPDRTRIAFARSGDLHVLRLEDRKLFLLPSDQKTIEPPRTHGLRVLLELASKRYPRPPGLQAHKTSLYWPVSNLGYHTDRNAS